MMTEEQKKSMAKDVSDIFDAIDLAESKKVKPARLSSLAKPRGACGRGDNRTSAKGANVLPFEGAERVRKLAERLGLFVITAEQLRLLQWAERQLEIRRLQDECEELLIEANSGSSLYITAE